MRSEISHAGDVISRMMLTNVCLIIEGVSCHKYPRGVRLLINNHYLLSIILTGEAERWLGVTTKCIVHRGGESSKVDTTALFGVIHWKQAAAEYFK